MQIPPKKKKVGEMGRPDNMDAMNKEFQADFKKNGPRVKQETRAEAEAAERGKGKMYVEKKMSINDPRRPRLMTAADRAGIKLKKMY